MRSPKRPEAELTLPLDAPESRGDGLGHGERWARRQGHQAVLGVDEVGRGPLAGPVVAGAVLLSAAAERELMEAGIDDSKKLAESRRRELAQRVREWGAVGLGVVDAARIDETDVLRASFEAMRRAVQQLLASGAPRPDCVLVDGKDPVEPSPLPQVPQYPLVRGDRRSVCIAAASVVAKVHRDALMVEYDGIHPGYGLADNKGYGSADHIEAIRRLGPSPVHRRSFRGVGGMPTAHDDRQTSLW